MAKAVFLSIACCAVLTGASSVAVRAAKSAQPHANTTRTPLEPRALLDKYCVTCHNQRSRTGGLALDAPDLSDVSTEAATWEKVVRKLRVGVMPPAGLPRPDAHAKDAFVSWLETELDRGAAASPDPGRTETFHRLNRTEYRNAIRDLLSLDVDVSSLLPAENASYGFDNIAAVLKVSPTLLERYLSAAQKISRLAVGRATPGANAEVFRVPADLSQENHIEGLPLGTRGGILIRHTFPQDGEYVLDARLARDTMDNVPRYPESHQLEVSIDGERQHLFTLEGEPDSEETLKRYVTGDRQGVDANWNVRLQVQAGLREVAVAFLKKPSALMDTTRVGGIRPPLSLQLKQPFQRGYLGGFANAEGRSQPYLSAVTIHGPFNARGASDTASRKRIFSCRPIKPSDEAGCARTILSILARRAYRRPVIDADLKPLLSFYEQGRQESGFEGGIELGLRALLASQAFLFRIERDPMGAASSTSYRISDLELASRLSFFLWSSIPDDTLVDLAGRGKLRSPGVLEQQVRRMLADSKSEAFVTNFAGQWLYLRNLPVTTPNIYVFPDFDESLRRSFRRETELFFDSIIREDRNVLDLLTADYTFVDERLAAHYGIPHVKGSHFRRVTLGDEHRGGLLGQGSILTVTSMANRTSPVIRGKWILENILGTSPPPPPPNVPSLKDNAKNEKALSMRERMVEHRANPACASCHAMMDPLGFSLENYDAVGRWRDKSESSAPVDASGRLPDGTAVNGPGEFKQSLLAHSTLFVNTLTEKLLVYGLGRGLEYYDMPTVRAIGRDAAQRDYRFSAIVLGIVNSTPFQMRKSQ